MYRFLLALFCFAVLNASAVPARPGAKTVVKQPDGTVLTLSVHGDESHHYYMTIDGMVVIGTVEGYFYAVIDDASLVTCSAQLAHEPNQRSDAESDMLSRINPTEVCQAIYNTPSQHRVTHDRVGTSAPGYPTTGHRKGLVFMVQYADVEFTMDNAEDYLRRMLNEEGFSLQNGTGSCRDYFIDSSNGMYTPEFDLYGPVTLPKERSYYGSNNSYGNDSNPQYMMLHAAQALDDEVDFSQYDLDGDGYVDYVFIFYPGQGESSGGGEDTVWPHSWEYPFYTKFDGVMFRKYACAPEYAYGTTPDGVGTFIHEFCHVLGLPDLYNVNDYNADYTPLTWSTLDVGCYNNDSRTPPSLSAFERNALGWMGDRLYEPTEEGEYQLLRLNEGNQAILLPTSNSDEFFILENRQQSGWDTYLPYHGMLVWHIDYNQSAWYGNVPNGDPKHQRVDIVEACNRNYSTRVGLRKYTFPGKENVTELGYNTIPGIADWEGNDIGYELTCIDETADGIITFDLSGASGITDVRATDADGYQLDGYRLTMSAPATVTDLYGRVILSASGGSAVLPTGIYIISVGDKKSKVCVK